jgi:importin subunit beta-1
METLLRIFTCNSSTVHEEAMLAVGAFTYALGDQFVKYMPAFYQYLKAGLNNYQEWQVGLLLSASAA